MKLSNVVYATAGYVLGARAGRERYDQIVSLARRVAGSQTVQATAGVLQGQLDQVTTHARKAFAGRIAGHHTTGQHSAGHQTADAGEAGVNGYRH